MSGTLHQLLTGLIISRKESTAPAGLFGCQRAVDSCPSANSHRTSRSKQDVNKLLKALRDLHQFEVLFVQNDAHDGRRFAVVENQLIAHRIECKGNHFVSRAALRDESL